MRREVILELFCNFFLDIGDLEAAFGIDFHVHFRDELDRLGPLAEDGLLRIESGALRVTDLGRFFVRNICMVFDRYLSSGGRGRYSKTV